MSDDTKAVERWRDDFPVRWDDDHYLTRRELAKFLTLGSALLTAATGALAVAGHTRSSAPFPAMPIPAAAALLPGTSLLFRYPTEADPCILIKTGRGELKAYSQVCTHLSCAVIPKPAEGVMDCPCHHGRFDAETGRVLAGPPPRPLPVIEVEERSDGIYALEARP